MTTIDRANRGIGLFGGTFDPVHNGHLTVARHALEALKLQRLDFVLAPSPWQKFVTTPPERRVEMLREAIEHEERMQVNLTEVMREGKTYTIDTLRAMREQVGPSVPLVLIMGADQWKNFHTWKDWEAFSSLVSIALCNREKHEPDVCDEAVRRTWLAGDREVEPHRIGEKSHGLITRFAVPEHKASSTKIREIFVQMPRDEAFLMLENWLPVRVAKLIARLHLY